MKDLTRWNREGLERFRYVDGNAVTHLETLSRRLEEAFPHWPEVTRFMRGSEEKPSQTRERMLAQYQAENRDWAWQILRTFARATHVLTEHIDAYANEAYLGTATQWDNLRRLVEMLDYHPRPPASATTSLVLIAKPGLSGVVEAGFQVKYAPEDGGPPVVFETLEDVAVDAALNGLRLEGWNRSPEPLAPEDDGESPPPGLHWVRADGGIMSDLELSAGQYGVLLNEATQDAVAVRLTEDMDLVAGRIGLEGGRADELERARSWPKGDTQLLVGPKAVRPVRLHGASVASFLDAHGLNAGDVLAWEDSKEPDLRKRWTFARVLESDVFAIRLSSDKLPQEGQAVCRAVSSPRPPCDVEFRFPAEFKAAFCWTGSEFRLLNKGPKPEEGTEPTGDYHRITGTESTDNVIHNANIAEIYLIADSAIAVGTIVAASPYKQVIDGKPGNLRTDQWIVGLGESAQDMRAMRLSHITEGENAFTVTFQAPDVTADLPLSQIVGPFQHVLRPLGHDANPTPLQGELLTVFVQSPFRKSPLPVRERARERVQMGRGTERLLLTLDASMAEAALPALTPGRRVVLECVTAEAGASVTGQSPLPSGERARERGQLSKGTNRSCHSPFQATIDEVHQDTNTLKLSVSLDKHAGFTVGNTIIRGNVVRAGHGERKPEKVLGSGAATRSHQTFLFETPEVSFDPDPTLTPGVRADIAISVADQRWEQVSTLNDSGPTDPHYTVRMTEDGHLRIGFGDATNGRRLPTGTNNVRIGYRVGSGLRGNLPAGRLERAVRPHRLIERVRQPLPATGGNDMEDKRSLRESAPSTLLTMERAVSLVDFANLACSHSSVWDARAFPKTGILDRYEHVDVTVVPAGGAELQELQHELTAFLEAHGSPHVRVAVERFEDVFLKLEVDLDIDTTAFDPEAVQDGVRTALFEAFTLRKRKLGQALSLGEVYQIVERVRGVANSVCAFANSLFEDSEEVAKPPTAERGPDGEPRIARPGPRQVLHLRERATDLTLELEEYEL